MARGRDVGVQSFRHTPVLEVRDDHREVVSSFVGNGELFAHSTSGTQSLGSREHSRELSVSTNK